MWVVLIITHAAAGVGAFAVGVAAVRPERARAHRWLLPTLLWMLVAMVVLVAGAILVRWEDLAGAVRVTFGALVILALYMVHRARQARNAIYAMTTTSERHRYMDSIGFVLISLFNGFVVVSSLDLGAPPWLVGGLAVAAAVVGHRLVASLKTTADMLGGI